MNFKKIRRLFCRILTGLLFLTLCGCSSKSEQPVRIPYLNTAQSEILANLLADIIQEQGIETKLVAASGIQDIHAAVESGSLDLYIDYSSRVWLDVLNQPKLYKKSYYNSLVMQFKEKGLTWISIPDLSGQYTLGVRTDIAEKYNLKTLSDLADVSSELVLGAGRSFLEEKEGYPFYQNAYSMTFGTLKDMTEGVEYDALSNKKIDVMPIYTFDGRLSSGKMVLLEDDLNLLADFSAGVVVRDSLLKAYPGLQERLRKTLRPLTSDDLQTANAMVIRNGTAPAKAASFLLKKLNAFYARKKVDQNPQ